MHKCTPHTHARAHTHHTHTCMRAHTCTHHTHAHTRTHTTHTHHTHTHTHTSHFLTKSPFLQFPPSLSIGASGVSLLAPLGPSTSALWGSHSSSSSPSALPLPPNFQQSPSSWGFWPLYPPWDGPSHQPLVSGDPHLLAAFSMSSSHLPPNSHTAVEGVWPSSLLPALPPPPWTWSWDEWGFWVWQQPPEDGVVAAACTSPCKPLRASCGRGPAAISSNS